MNYIDYYNRTIKNYSVGLKLVVGGTGLGKTSSIKKTVQSSGKKAIYVANRLQLLEEMARNDSDNSIVFLRRDFEAVLQTLKHHQDDLFRLLDKYMGYAPKIDVPRLRRTCRMLHELHNQHIPQFLEDKIDEQARMILWDFKILILAAKQMSPKDYQELLSHPAIWSLFPFIRFKHDPKSRLLLVTLHKLFYGFFDGEATLNISKLQDYIVFLDEFDFLENDLIQLICQSPQINDPFRFVEFFYNEMHRHKLLLPEYPVSALVGGIRRRIEEFQTEIDNLQESGIQYPQINQFTRSTNQTENIAIFRTQHIVTTKPIALCQTNRAFKIIMTEGDSCDGNKFSARRLFTTVSAVSERILTLLKELERDDPNTHRDLLHDCFRNTEFLDIVGQISQFPRPRRDQVSRLGALLDSGYSLYDIHHVEKGTDPEEVELRHYAIYVTPEKILESLAEKNLVFGLSATADIPRCVNHFNLSWLRSAINVIEIDQPDKQIITSLNNEKAGQRNNRIGVELLADLDYHDPYEKSLQRFVVSMAQNEEGFGKDTREGHLKKRVARFFKALLWMSNKPNDVLATDSHLMFLTTFKQIKYVFDKSLEVSNDVDFKVKLLNEQNLFATYEIQFRGQTFLVVFYNAELARQVRVNSEAESQFNSLFWQGYPAIVVTQYLSAGNGVNLQYYPTRDAKHKQDFVNLHLLEAPYFYFGNLDAELPVEDRFAIVKKNIWYQAKLHAAKYISESDFRTALGELHNPYDWNNRYRSHPHTNSDYLLNSMAAFIQALGRIEREWQPTPDQTVVMSNEVYSYFKLFLSERFAHIREDRSAIISDNLRQIFEQIAALNERQTQSTSIKKDSRLSLKNSQCIDSVSNLLQRLEHLRSGIQDNEAQYIWQYLRKAALKHDFADGLLEEFSCIFESHYVENGRLYLTPEKDMIPATLADQDTYPWRLNSIYDTIIQNEIISRHFLSHGYQLDFDPESQKFFVPYFYQAILAGAVGEEAITSLLNHHTLPLEALPDRLFEIADLKIEHQPWYIDCKNYSEFTLHRFSLEPNDPLYHPKLADDHFRQHAIKKWQKIAAFDGPTSKLIYINLSTAHNRPLSYYTGQSATVHHFDEANIIVVQGALHRQNPNEYHETFIRLLNELSHHLNR